MIATGAHGSHTAVGAGAAVLVLALSGCLNGGIGAGSDDGSTVSPTSPESPTVITNFSADRSEETADGADGSADSQGSGGAGQVSYVEFGNALRSRVHAVP